MLGLKLGKLLKTILLVDLQRKNLPLVQTMPRWAILQTVDLKKLTNLKFHNPQQQKLVKIPIQSLLQPIKVLWMPLLVLWDKKLQIMRWKLGREWVVSLLMGQLLNCSLELAGKRLMLAWMMDLKSWICYRHSCWFFYRWFICKRRGGSNWQQSAWRFWWVLHIY